MANELFLSEAKEGSAPRPVGPHSSPSPLLIEAWLYAALETFLSVSPQTVCFLRAGNVFC